MTVKFIFALECYVLATKAAVSLLLDYPLMHLHPCEELIDCLAAWCTLLSRLLFHHLLLELLHEKKRLRVFEH